ncbi:MAG: hypothetical protein WCK65_02530 [Rhodospirillaceae bacterium]
MTSDIRQIEYSRALYSIQAGPLNEAAARALCELLKERGQGCQITQTNGR